MREGGTLEQTTKGHWCEHCMSDQLAAERLTVLVCTDEVAERG